MRVAPRGLLAAALALVAGRGQPVPQEDAPHRLYRTRRAARKARSFRRRNEKAARDKAAGIAARRVRTRLGPTRFRPQCKCGATIDYAAFQKAWPCTKCQLKALEKVA